MTVARTARASALTASALTASVLAASVCAGLAASAQAETAATIAPSLSPDRLGARAALTFTIRYSEEELGVPAPVRRSVLRFPAGMSLDVPSLRSCSAARLRARGPNGCPVQSELGGGHALVETRPASEIITESATLWAFLGPPENLQPTFEILAQGYTPLDERVVFSGRVLPDQAPYGEKLVMSIPPIPTLVLEPDASVVTFTLTIGARHGARAGNAIAVPSHCPAGGFPFAAEFTYADGTSGSAHATVPCPR